MKISLEAELEKERDALQEEYSRNDARQAYLRRRLSALAVLLDEDDPTEKSNGALVSPVAQAQQAQAQQDMPFDDGRSQTDLVKSVIATFKPDQTFTSQNVLAELQKLRPSIKETSQFGPAMIRLVKTGVIKVVEERRGRAPAKYAKI